MKRALALALAASLVLVLLVAGPTQASAVNAELAVVGQTATTIDLQVTQTSGGAAVFLVTHHCLSSYGMFDTTKRAFSGDVLTFTTSGFLSCIAQVRQFKNILGNLLRGPVLDEITTV